MTEIAIAFDVPTLEAAIALDERLGEGPELAKVGLQLYTAAGPDAVRALRARGRRVFLDLKLHDIPNTVRGAAAAAGALDVELLTVHATGGGAMLRAAVEGAAQGGTKVVAVTVLTSLDAYSMPPGFEHPFHVSFVQLRLLELAERSGAAGIVCAAVDLGPLRGARRGRPFFSVTPGIRPAGMAAQDQARIATIGEAAALGADVVVLGRAITADPEPRAALERARAEAHGASRALQGQGAQTLDLTPREA